MKLLSSLVIGVILLVAPASSGVFGAGASDYWPTWRGADSTGISREGDPPLTWSETKNIRWKVRLIGDGSNSSPIIWEDRIFFQTAIKTDVKGKTGSSDAAGKADGKRRFGGTPPTNVYRFNLVCLDRRTGKLIWQKTVREELPHEGHHADHGFVSFSPVTDGRLIWANFGSRGVYCFDQEGNPKWSRDLGKMNTVMSFGEGGSLAVAGDAIIVVRDHQGDSTIVALNRETGETIWKKDRDEPTSWATPLVVEAKGKKQVVVSATNLIRSYDPKTGSIIWQAGGNTRNVIPTPVAGFGMVYCASGFRDSSLQAIDLHRTGDLTNTDAVRWHVKKATPYVPSPLLYGDKIYVVSVNAGVISCYNAKTGVPYFFKERLKGTSGIYASPAAAAGRIYFVGRNGVTYVLRPSEKLEILAINKLEDRIECSPAFAGNEMYLKGKENLYCIATPE